MRARLRRVGGRAPLHLRMQQLEEGVLVSRVPGLEGGADQGDVVVRAHRAGHPADHPAADRPGMPGQCLELAAEAERVAGEAELAQGRRGVEVDALADQLVVVEHEDRQDRQLEAAPGRRQVAEGAGVGAAHHRLDQDRGVGMVQGQQLVALVGEGAPRLLEVRHHLLGPVVDLAGPHQLVAGVMEGGEGVVELVAVLGVHVLAHDLLALAPQQRIRRQAAYLPVTRRIRPRPIVSGWLASISTPPVRLSGSRAMPSCWSTVAVS